MIAGLSRGIVISLFVLVACPPCARAQDRFDDVTIEAESDGGLVDADALLMLWARKLGVHMAVDRQIAGTKLRGSPGTMTWGAFKRILDFHDIVLVQRELPGTTIMFAHLRRNLPGLAGPPSPLVPADQAAKHPDEIITTLIPIQHGAGGDIFATVRGLLVRDVNRVANILYVRGPEAIILVDLGANVAYYASVIRALDVPGVGVKVHDLQHANAEDAAQALASLADTFSGTRVIAAPRTNQLIVTAGASDMRRLGEVIDRIDVPSGVQRPRYKADTMPIALWKIATAFAVVAFIGQTILLRRFQRRALLTKLSV